MKALRITLALTFSTLAIAASLLLSNVAFAQCPVISVSPASLSNGTNGTPYGPVAFSALPAAAYTFEASGLPTGLTMSAGGSLSGTPTQSGTFAVRTIATDAGGCVATHTIPLIIGCGTITVTNPATTTGTVDAAFSQTFTQTGATGTATFTLNSGSLPAGFSLSAAGVLSGTPSAPGSFPITVKVTDSSGCIGISGTYTLVISCQTITVSNPGVTTGTVDAAFSQTFTQVGVGTHTPATFTLNSGSLPAGFSLSAAGVLSGTPGAPGSFPITVKVTDANGCTGISLTYTLVISCQTITVSNPGVTTGTVDAAFSQTFTQVGVGTHTPATFTLNSGSLPAGMSLSAAGVLSGTPGAPGSFPITVKVTDANGCTGISATYTLVISCQTITVSNPGVTTGTVDAAFSQTFTQVGVGTHTPATFTLNSGSLPAGMSLSAAGVLSGTPGAPGSFPITVKVTDANGCTGISATYTLVIACQTITVSNPGVTTGTVDAAFSQTFTQVGVGTHTPATFTLNSGSLPAGMSLSAAGVLSGTPGAPGSFPITVKVTDANGCTGISATYTLVIACQTITVTNPVTTTGTFNAAFSQTFTQSGVGTHTPANFTLNSGTLPTGLSLATTGVLSGTPTQTGTFNITVKVTDANGCTGTGATYALKIAPTAPTQAYANGVGNTQYFITGVAGAPATPAVSSATTLLNGVLPAGFVTVTAASCTVNGVITTFDATGHFVFTPNVAAASPTCTYTVSSDSGGTGTPVTATATLSIPLTNRVWYVNNSGAAGDGRSQSPFNTLAAAQAASAASDIIFIHLGNTVASPLAAGISLKDGQKLWGEGFGLTVNTVVLVPAGTQARINNAAGAAVTVDTSAAPAGNRQNVEVKGLDLQGTTNGVNVTSNAATLTSVTISGNNVRGAGTQGINLNQSSTGTFGATVSTNTITSTGNGIQGRTNTAGTMTITEASNTINATANGVDIRTLAGAAALQLSVDAETVTAAAAAGAGIFIDGTLAGTTTITSFNGNVISGNTAGSGILVITATFDATPGGTFQTVPGGNTAIGASGNGVGAAGMWLINVAGDLSFTDLDIFADNGAGMRAIGLAAYTGSVGFQIAVSAGVANITAINGPAVDLTTVTANLPFQTITSTNSTTTGVNLNAVPGTFSAGFGSAISNATGTDFSINAGNAAVTYHGTIVDTTGQVVSITNATGGTKSFTGAITNNGGTGIFLNANTGATINFSGTLTLSTGANPAFTATGGGTVTATDANSTVITTTGTAVNVANTTIGVSNLKFQSVSAGTAASGPASGIILNNTGVLGALVVTGTGSAGSGGTIQKATNNAIDMTSTGATSFSWMIIQNSTHLGINGTTLAGFTLANSSVLNNGTTANADHGIKLLDVSGTATFTSDTVTGNHVTNLFFGGTVSSTTVTNSLTVSNGTYGSSATNSGIQVGMTHTSVLKTATFTGVTFSGNASTGLQVQSNDNSIVGDGVGAPATGTVTVSGCTFTNNAGNTAMDIDQGGGNGAGQMYARLMNNTTITGNGGPTINIFTSSSATGGTMKVRIDGNHVGNAGTFGSGSTLGPGIRVFLQGKTTSTITIVNNIVRQTPGSRAIDVEALGPVTVGQPLTVSDLLITGNDSNTNEASAISLGAIYVAADNQGSAAQINAEIHGNTLPTGGCADYPTFDGNAPWLYYRIQTSGAVAKLFNFGGHANANTEISTTQTAGTAGADIANFGGVQLTATPVNSIP